MKQIVQNMKNGATEIAEVPVPAVKSGYLLVKTAASLVSSGTERMLVDFAEKNLVEKARSRPDLFKQVIQKAQRDGILTTLESAFNRLDQPIVLGYSSAGIVVETGKNVSEFAVGDRVACAGGGHAVHAEYALVPVNLAVKIPDQVPFEAGAFATIGAIALNGIRLAQPQVGERTAVIGLGLLGLLAAQILKASGCAVTGLEIDKDRIDLAKQIGIEGYTNEYVVANYESMTGGAGFDHIFICADTPSSQPVELAGKIAHDRGTIVAIGAIGMQIPRKPYYEKELKFMVSRSYGPGRYDRSYEEKGHDYPAGYVRWTEQRNLSAIITLISNGDIDVSNLITHRFPIDRADKAYQMLSNKSGEKYLGLMITYPEKTKDCVPNRKINLSSTHSKTNKDILNVGVLGAGNYANAVFLPIIQKHPQTHCFGILSAKGLNAQQSGKKFNFEFASSSKTDIIDNKDIDIVTVLTRHDSHAALSAQALENGKHVFCEKPLAVDMEELSPVEDQLKKDDHPYFTVGFNRRFAPFITEIKSQLHTTSEPIYSHYRVNAGTIPIDHWLHDPSSGGGRLIGEACHFIDLMLYLIDSEPVTVRTQSLPNIRKYQNDNLLITIKFLDGSLASIAYIANGSRLAGKEYLEIFTSGKTWIMDDFRKLTIVGQTKKTKRQFGKKDKGHASLWKAFIKAIQNQTQPPIPYAALLQSSMTTLACSRSMQSGTAVNIQAFING